MKKFSIALLIALIVVSVFSVAAMADSSNTNCELKGEEHTYSSWVVDTKPTCTEPGIESRACTKCGYTDKTQHQTIPATGHTYGDWTVTTAATCMTDGVQEHTCKTCGKVETSKIAVVSDQHVYGEPKVSVPATCEKEGEAVYFCALNSSETHTKKVVLKPTGHSKATEWVEKVITAPTCTKVGEMGLYCPKCDKLMDTKAIPMVAHELTGHKVVVEPTCTTDGTYEAVCVNCHGTFTSAQIKTLAIAKLGHAYKGEETKKATCKEDGVDTYTCTRKGCDASYTIKVPASTVAHTYKETIAVEAVGTEPGLKCYTCTVCGDYYEKTYTLTVKPADPTEKPADPTEKPADPTEKPTVKPTQKPSSGNSSSNSSSGVEIPATGDTTSIMPYMMLVAAVAGLVALVASKRKVNG